MPAKKQVRPDEKLPLKLTAAQRKLVLEDLTCLDREIAQVFQDTPSGQPVKLTLDELDDLGGFVAAEANHCQNKSKARKLHAVFDKIQSLLDKFTDEAPPKTFNIDAARLETQISDQARHIAEFAAQALVAAEQLGINKSSLAHFCLAPAERELLVLVPGVTKTLKKKLANEGATFSMMEVASMTLALAEALPDGDARSQLAIMYLAEHLTDHLQRGISSAGTPKPSQQTRSRRKCSSDVLFQFKIALQGVNPPIWRRIQTKDCKLDKLHEHIQTAMGWTNSHLHQFEIEGRRYGDPGLLGDGFDDFECVDSTNTMLSQILPKAGERFAFKYEYDFGDSWEHNVLFEGRPRVDPDADYPLCLEGKRACPPEDCGGIWGYAEFLEAISDPKHVEHQNLLDWIGEAFDPESFDATKTTKKMKCGLPDWRSMR